MGNENSMNGKRFLEFKLGEEHYAVELLKVREVITPPELTPIPKSPSYVCGLMNLRGLVLTVVDLRKKLSIIPCQEQSESAVIIFELGDRLVGGQVDNINRVLHVSEEHFRPVPESDNSSLTQHLSGIIQYQDKLILILDLNKIFSTNQSSNTKAA